MSTDTWVFVFQPNEIISDYMSVDENYMLRRKRFANFLHLKGVAAIGKYALVLVNIIRAFS